MARSPRSLLELCLALGGMRKGIRVATFIVCWAIAERESGGLANGSLTAAMRTYAAYWRESERTAWRELKVFREVFPDTETPHEMALQLLDRADEWADQGAAGGLSALGRVPVVA